MAKITTSALVSKISGKIGSLIFSSWKGLQYSKLLPVVIHNPNTPAQAQMRTNLIDLLSDWAVFTPQQKALWEEYAQGLGSQSANISSIGSRGLIKPTGDVMSGINAYIGINQRLLQCEMTRVSTPPPVAVSGPINFNAVQSGNNISVTVVFPAGSLVVDDYIRIFLRSDKRGGHTYLAVKHKVVSGDIDGVTGIIMIQPDITTVRLGHGGIIQEVNIDQLEQHPISVQADAVSQSGYKTAPSAVVGVMLNPL